MSRVPAVPTYWRACPLRINYSALPPLPSLPARHACIARPGGLKYDSLPESERIAIVARARRAPGGDDDGELRDLPGPNPLADPCLSNLAFIGDAVFTSLVRASVTRVHMPRAYWNSVNPKVAAGLIVSNDTMSYISRFYGLEDLLSPDHRLQKEREQHMQADLFEAYIGAVADTGDELAPADESHSYLAHPTAFRHHTELQTFARRLVSSEVFPTLWEDSRNFILAQKQMYADEWKARKNNGSGSP